MMKNSVMISTLIFFLLVPNLFPIFGQTDSSVFAPVDLSVIKFGQTLLFDSKTWIGWRVQKDGPYGGGHFRIEKGAFCSDPAHPGLLLTTGQFSNFLLEFEMQAEDESDAFLLLRTSPNPKNLATSCYAVVLTASSAHPERHPCSILGRRMRSSTPDDFNKKNADGTYPWKRFHVSVHEKGIRINCGPFVSNESFDEESVRRGYIGFLVTRGKVRFRNIEWSPSQTLPVFRSGNRQLNFWKPPEENTGFSVHSDTMELRLNGGPGILETQASFGNFTLRAEFNTADSQSGGDIFFRCFTGEMLAGYRCSLGHRFPENDSIKTFGERIGSLVSLKEARDVGARNDQWNSLIIKAVDNHFQTWVNGVQTVDYTDRRPADALENPQNGLRLKEGTIQIHSQSLGSALKFRNIEVASIPKRWISREEEQFLREQRSRELLPPRPRAEAYQQLNLE